MALAPLPQLPAWIQTDLFRTAAIRDLRFAEALRLPEDLHYIMRCYLRGDAAFIAEPMVHVRRHDSNSYKAPEEMLRPVIRSLQLLAESSSPPQRRALSVRIGNAWLALGYHHWGRSSLTASGAYMRAALKPGRRFNAIAHSAAASMRHSCAGLIGPPVASDDRRRHLVPSAGAQYGRSSLGVVLARAVSFFMLPVYTRYLSTAIQGPAAAGHDDGYREHPVRRWHDLRDGTLLLSDERHACAERLCAPHSCWSCRSLSPQGSPSPSARRGFGGTTTRCRHSGAGTYRWREPGTRYDGLRPAELAYS